MTEYTFNHLRDVQDLGSALGVETAQEVRFPQMDAETAGLSLMRVKPGQRQAVAHHHTQAEEIYVIVTGAGRIKLNDDIRDVKPLDAIRIAPSVVRAVEAGPDGSGELDRSFERPGASAVRRSARHKPIGGRCGLARGGRCVAMLHGWAEHERAYPG